MHSIVNSHLKHVAAYPQYGDIKAYKESMRRLKEFSDSSLKQACSGPSAISNPKIGQGQRGPKLQRDLRKHLPVRQDPTRSRNRVKFATEDHTVPPLRHLSLHLTEGQGLHRQSQRSILKPMEPAMQSRQQKEASMLKKMIRSNSVIRDTYLNTIKNERLSLLSE